jgi:hypothetical protein
MHRPTALWALVLFFGGMLLFGAINNATEGEALALRLGLQVLALAVVIGGIVLVVRRQR